MSHVSTCKLLRNINYAGRNSSLFHLRPDNNIVNQFLHSRKSSSCISKVGVIGKGESGEFPIKYVPKDVEAERYQWWEQNGCFSVQTGSGDAFSIILPPPNVTGTLHIGHTLTATIQDVYSRWFKMQGKPVSWIPGLDHAGIATQVVFERKLWQERGLTRFDLGRDQFVQELVHWKNQKAFRIAQQLKDLGACLDWSRAFFTMDEEQSAAVTEAFIRLYESGLVYRSETLVNWSCFLHSTISDIEVDYKTIEEPSKLSVPGYSEPVEFGVLTNIAYKLCNMEGEVVVATTRPETMLGDVAVAVHPEDWRYKHLHGAQVWHPFRCEKLPIICDEGVNPDLGTGVLKVTPAHDHADFEIGKRHQLQTLTIILDDGRLNDACGQFAGMKRFDARKLIIAELEKRGLYRGSSKHKMQLPLCSRSGDVLEFLLKPQWFINCQEMGQKALNAVKEGRLKIEPSFYESNWFSWLENVRDWCVSRQLWWGHRIPMYLCRLKEGEASGPVWVPARNTREACETAALKLDSGPESVVAEQDEDVLDTWFSSALLPFSVHGWPKQTEDLKTYYPLTMMETGHDILCFWVARMVMLGEQLTGQLPFKKVLLHGVISDPQGRKMSKSLGNVIYPENVIRGISLKGLNEQARQSYKEGILSQQELEKAIEGQTRLFPSGIPECGTDALRFSLCLQNAQNVFMNFDVTHCHNSYLLCNKIWQACRYIQKCRDSTPDYEEMRATLSLADRWILSQLTGMLNEVHHGLQDTQLHLATHALRHFILSNFCDVYLETTKPLFKTPQSSQAKAACWTLVHCMDTFLHALSPFMPFISEELYQLLKINKEGGKVLMNDRYPNPDQWSHWSNKQLEADFSNVMDIVSTVRRMKLVNNIPKSKPEIYIVCKTEEHLELYQQYADVIQTLARCEISEFYLQAPINLQLNAIMDTANSCSVYLIHEDSKEYEKTLDYYAKKVEKISKQLERLLKMTSSKGYKSKASIEIQQSHSQKIRALEDELKMISEVQKARQQVGSSSS